MSAFRKTAFVFGLCLLYVSVLSQPNKRVKVRFGINDGFFFGIPGEYADKHLEDSLAKWFGRPKAKDILAKCEAGYWPKSAFNVLVELNPDKINEYFSKLNAWKILSFSKSYHILEVRPQDNKFLGDTSFHNSFYIFMDRSEPLAQVDWKVTDTEIGIATAPAGSDDDAIRKSFLVSGKKKFLTGQRKLHEEVAKVTVSASEHMPILTPFPENVNRIVLLMCEGQDNDILISYTEDDDYKTKRVLPSSKDEIPGYTFFRFSFFNKSSKVYIENNRKSTLTYTYLFITEKNDTAYHQYLAKQKQKEISEKQQQAANAVADAEDYQRARDFINQIRNKTDLFIRQGEWTLDYTVSYAEKNNWGWDEYLKHYKKLLGLYSDIASLYKTSTGKMSTSNPNYQKVVDWFNNTSTQIKNISELIQRDVQVFEKSKNPSLYTFKSTYQEMIRMGKKIYDKEY